MHAHGMIGELDVLGFLLLGLLGGAAHCAPMCSPFVLFVSSRYAAPGAGRSVHAAQGWYAGGRIAMYSALGALAGAFGGAVQAAGAMVGVQRAAAAIAGAVLVASALAALAGSRFKLGPDASWLGGVTRRLYQHVPGHPFVMGMILGLLPCGLVYTAVMAGVARGSAGAGAMALIAFGLGTLPTLVGVAFANSFLFNRRPILNRAAQVFVLVMGAWYLWRGLA